MSLGSSDMAGSALGTASSLLLLASIIQGRPDFEVFHHEKVEAVVGQNVTLPCTVQRNTGVHISGVEWSKGRKENTKLVVYSQRYGPYEYWRNVTIQIENKSMSSYLHLSGVSTWDSGIYICDLATFPLGSIRRETELQIKDVDVEIMCDADRAIEVRNGENVTIRCRAVHNAEYRWTKNKMLVSENECLELRWVTDAHTGVYALTVNTGNKSLHKDFVVTVLTATTGLRTDAVTVSPQWSVTQEGLIGSTDGGRPTSPTTGPPATDIDVTQATSTDDNSNLSNVTTTAGEPATSSANSTHINVTSSPAAHQEITPTYSVNTSTSSDRATSNQTTTLGYDSTVFRSTQEPRNESTGSMTDDPAATPTLSPGGSTTVTENTDTDGARTHLWLLLIITPLLVLIAVAGFLCRRQVIKQRMDLPPPFKPPPPPVKYAPARRHEPFPISRCNSVTELRDMKHRSINI